MVRVRIMIHVTGMVKLRSQLGLDFKICVMGRVAFWFWLSISFMNHGEGEGETFGLVAKVKVTFSFRVKFKMRIC